MDAKIVDERDMRWEADANVFRVEIVERDSASATYEIRDRSIVEVVDWAQRIAAGRSFSIAAVVEESGRGKGLLLLTPQVTYMAHAVQGLSS